MKLAEYLSRKVNMRECDPKTVPAPVRNGVVRFYAKRDVVSDFAWAEREYSHAKPTRS